MKKKLLSMLLTISSFTPFFGVYSHHTHHNDDPPCNHESLQEAREHQSH